MGIKEFIRAFVSHAAFAFIVWFVIVVMLEYLMPGFATPFIDLADLSIVCLVVTIITVFIASPSTTRASKVATGLLIICSVGICIAFLRFALNDLGMLDLALLASALLSSILILYVLFIRPPTTD